MSIHRSKARDQGRDPDKWPGRRPARAELLEAYGATIPDLIGPDLRVLLVGINPSLYSGWTGHHFARPGNRLWRTLAEAGFTDRILLPYELEAVVAAGLGITNLVARSSARADELDADEIRAGVQPLARLVRRARPRFVAFLGVSTFRIAFDHPKAQVGRQDERFEGAVAWVLRRATCGLHALVLGDLEARHVVLRRLGVVGAPGAAVLAVDARLVERGSRA